MGKNKKYEQDPESTSSNNIEARIKNKTNEK